MDGRVLRIHEHGGPEVLRIEREPAREPGAGEVLLRMEAFALNHLDLWIRRGIPGVKYPLPVVPGSDGAGRVEALGPGVDDLAPGTRVVLLPGRSCGHCIRCLSGQDNLCASYGIFGESCDGAARDWMVVSRANVAPAPAHLSAAEAASFALTFLTAWQMLVHKARVVPGDRVLVHAAASGVGVAAVQIARHLGAVIAATASTPEKRALAERLGADVTFDSKDPDWSKTVRAWAAPRGLDVVFDSVGQDTFAPSLRVLAKGGRYVFCGSTSGPKLETDFRLVFFKNYEILGSTMGRRGDLFRVIDLFTAGRFQPIVDRVFPLEQVGEAHAHLEARKAMGKVVVSLV